MALRVFISHASQDSVFAEELANDLRRAGADVWLDATHIGPGNFLQRINQAINARDVLVLVLTPDALTSQWVPDEMDSAIVRYKQGFMRAPIVVLEKPLSLRDIPALWTTYNRIDATKDYNRALPEIARALGLTLPVVTPPMSKVVPGSKPTPALSATPPPTTAPPVPAPGATSAPTTASPAQSTSSVAVAPSVGVASPLSRRKLLVATGAIAVVMASIGGAEWWAHVEPGAKRWSYQTGGSVTSSPAVANGVVYIGSDDSFVYALDASTGAKRWSYQTGSVVDSSLAVANGVVYIGSWSGSVFAINA